MRKKYSFLIATSIFLLLLVPAIGMAEVDEDVMTPGDTFIYEVTKFDIPIEELLGGMEAPFPMEDFVFDLSGSTLGVKVMALDANDGFYALNVYVILGDDVEIPIPEEALTPEVEDVFGDKFIIPEGVGIGLGQTLPGSDFLEFIAEDYDGQYAGLPFYLDPNEWNEYEDMFEDLGDTLSDAGVDLTTEEADGEFILSLEGAVGEGAQYTETSTEETTTIPWWYTEETTTETVVVASGPEIDGDIIFEVAWFASGDHEGLFKRVEGTFEGDIGEATNIDVNIEVSFKEKRHNPLPDAILDEETITLEMDTAAFSYDTTGFFDDNNDLQDQLEEMEDQLDDVEGEDIYEFEVEDVDGCFYETTISMYDGNNLDEMDDTVWWNGFIGSQGWLDDWGDSPWKDWQIYPSSPFGIIPLMAPGITPDWDMWQASTLSISSIVEIAQAAITSSDAEDSLDALGLTINEFDLTYEMRGNNDFKFFYFTGEVDLSFDAADADEWPSEDPEEPKADVTVKVEMWLGYTADGLIASIGVELMLDATIEEFPVGENYNEDTYEYETYYDDGSLTLELKAEIINKDVDNVPNPDKLPKDTEGEDGDGGGLPTPGFSVIPALVLVAAIAVIIKRRK